MNKRGIFPLPLKFLNPLYVPQNLLVYYIYICITFIAENLSRKSTTSVMQSSTLTFHTATLVNDGNNGTTEMYCAHTELNWTKAWLQIDLGHPYSIRSVKIFYRNEGILFTFSLKVYPHK